MGKATEARRRQPTRWQPAVARSIPNSTRPGMGWGGRKLIRRGHGDDGRRRHEDCGSGLEDGSGISHLELGRGRRRLDRFRRCGAQPVRPRVHPRPPFACAARSRASRQRAYNASWRDDEALSPSRSPPRPGTAMAVETIDPVPAISRRLARLRAAPLCGGNRRDGLPFETH